MTIEELYQWAKEHDALNLEIEVYDSTGCHTSWIDPEIVDYSGYYAVVQL